MYHAGHSVLFCSVPKSDGACQVSLSRRRIHHECFFAWLHRAVLQYHGCDGKGIGAMLCYAAGGLTSSSALIP